MYPGEERCGVGFGGSLSLLVSLGVWAMNVTKLLIFSFEFILQVTVECQALTKPRTLGSGSTASLQGGLAKNPIVWYILKSNCRDWRDGTVLKSIYYSCKGPESGSQHPHLAAHNACNSSSRGSDTLFSCLCRP